MSYPVITVYKFSRYSFVMIPSFFCQVIMVIVFICFIAIGIFLKSRLVAFIEPGFT